MSRPQPASGPGANGHRRQLPGAGPSVGGQQAAAHEHLGQEERRVPKTSSEQRYTASRSRARSASPSQREGLIIFNVCQLLGRKAESRLMGVPSLTPLGEPPPSLRAEVVVTEAAGSSTPEKLVGAAPSPAQSALDTAAAPYPRRSPHRPNDSGRCEIGSLGAQLVLHVEESASPAPSLVVVEVLRSARSAGSRPQPFWRVR